MDYYLKVIQEGYYVKWDEDWEFLSDSLHKAKRHVSTQINYSSWSPRSDITEPLYADNKEVKIAYFNNANDSFRLLCFRTKKSKWKGL